MKNHLAASIKHANGDAAIKHRFLHRLNEGLLTRRENPTSHLCVYFAAHDPAAGRVFIGHHKKSDLWLFNGGHMDPGETPTETVIREAAEEWGMNLDPHTIPAPQLITLTQIEHPEKIICEWHYDLWHFLPFDRNSFRPVDANLYTEFFSFGWKHYDEAEKLLTSQPTIEALHYLRKRK